LKHTTNTMTMTGPANADANGPPPDISDYPSLPKLASPGWVTPPYLPPDSHDHDLYVRREVNHKAYHQTGNPLTWYHYVLFGYYGFDSVAEFEAAWNPEQNVHLARYRIIMWDSFHKNRMSNTTSTPILTTWATKYARPYRHHHEPDYLLATEIIYDDHLDNADVNGTSTPEPDLPWTEIGWLKSQEQVDKRRLSTFTPPSLNSDPGRNVLSPTPKRHFRQC
jgi:hypothetical protein